MSPTIATVTLPLTVLPAVVIVLGIRARKPFFIQLRNALIAAVAGALLAIVLAVALIGGDMVSQFMDMLRLLSDGAMPSLYEIYLPVLESRGASVTYEQFLAAYREVLATMQILYETNLAGAVLADSIVTALIAALWGNWISARHGDATAESFIGLAGVAYALEHDDRAVAGIGGGRHTRGDWNARRGNRLGSNQQYRLSRLLRPALRGERSPSESRGRNARQAHRHGHSAVRADSDRADCKDARTSHRRSVGAVRTHRRGHALEAKA